MNRLSLALLAAVTIAGCNGHPNVQLAPYQRAVEYPRVSRYEAYKATDNEIQESALFNQANAEMKAAIDRTGAFAKGWVGKIDEIRTDHGGGNARVKIRSSTNSIYQSDEDVPAGSPVYQQLSSLTVGQQVTFSAKLVPHGDGYEWSLTERGSLEEPEFRVVFTSIVPYGTPEPAMAHVEPVSAKPVAAAASPSPIRKPVKLGLVLKPQWDRIEQNNSPNAYMVSLIYSEPPTGEEVGTDTSEVVNTIFQRLKAKGLDPIKDSIGVVCDAEVHLTSPTGRQITRVYGNTAYDGDLHKIVTRLGITEIDMTDIPDLADHSTDIVRDK